MHNGTVVIYHRPIYLLLPPNRLEFPGTLCRLCVYMICLQNGEKISSIPIRRSNKAAGIMDVRLEFRVNSGLQTKQDGNVTKQSIFMRFSTAATTKHQLQQSLRHRKISDRMKFKMAARNRK